MAWVIEKYRLVPARSIPRKSISLSVAPSVFEFGYNVPAPESEAKSPYDLQNFGLARQVNSPSKYAAEVFEEGQIWPEIRAWKNPNLRLRVPSRCS